MADNKHIKEQSQNYQDIVDNLPDLICEWLPDGTLLYANPAYCQYYNKKQQDLAGKSCLDNIHPDDKEKLYGHISKLLEQKSHEGIELRIFDSKGEVRWHQWYDKFIPGHQTKDQKFLSTGRDITYLKQAQFELGHRIAFERLISNLSISFINTKPEDFDQNINLLLAKIGQFSKVDRSYVFLIDEQQSILTNTHEWCNKGIQPQKQNSQQVPCATHPWVMERLENLETIYIPNVDELPAKANLDKKIFKSQSIESLIVVPLVNDNLLLGFIGFDSVRQKKAWQDDDVTLLRIVASIISNAIAQKKKSEDIAQRRLYLEKINQITVASLNSQNVMEMLNIVVSQMGSLIQADDCSINLWDELRHEISHSSYSIDISKYGEQIEIQPGEASLNSYVLAEKKPVAITDIQNSPFVNQRIAKIFGTRSILGVPMISGDKVLGSVIFGFSKAHIFTEDEIAVTEQAISQVVLALLKIHLLDQAQKYAERADTLYKASSIVASTLDPKIAIQRILEQLERVVPFDCASVQILVNNHLVIKDGRGWPKEQNPIGYQFPIPGDNPNTLVIKKRQPHVINDTFNSESNYIHINQFITRSWLGVPLIVHDKVIGMVTLNHRQPNFYSDPQMVQLVSAFADQVAISLENARLYEEEHQRVLELDALRATTADITKELALENLISAILERATLLLNASGGELGLLDEAEGKIKIHFSHNMGKDTAGTSLKFGEGLMGRVSLTHKIELIEDYQNWVGQLEPYKTCQIHAAIAAPLMIGEHFLGVLGLIDTNRKRQFTESEKGLLNLFAQQAAIAVENAKLYEERKRQAYFDITTGIYNRRGLSDLGQLELERSIRYERPLAAIMLDIDHFKVTNDTYGHPIGDMVLQELTSRLKDNLRSIDILSRYGGEEFAILLPETDIESAKLVAVRLREAVSKSNFSPKTFSIPITISLGVAITKGEKGDLTELLNHADIAMYQSKDAGRNCVRIYQI